MHTPDYLSDSDVMLTTFGDLLEQANQIEVFGDKEVGDLLGKLVRVAHAQAEECRALREDNARLRDAIRHLETRTAYAEDRLDTHATEIGALQCTRAPVVVHRAAVLPVLDLEPAPI
jgi:hypothetical protein